MRAILALAAKDLQILIRVKIGLFFTFVWPFLVAILFGVMFSGPGQESSKIGIAVADEDSSIRSTDFISRLEKGGKFDILKTSRDTATSLVRQGKRTAALIFPRGFGEALGRMFYGKPPRVEILIDPSRKAESAMIEGLLFQQAAEGMQKFFSDRTASQKMIQRSLKDLDSSPNIPGQERESLGRFLGDLDKVLSGAPQQQARPGEASSWQPLEIEEKEVAREHSGPKNAFDVTFPQGIIWGIIGCVMTFGIGIVTERTQGTLMRLQIAPLTRAQILGGKALACFASIVIVQAGLFIVGWAFFKVYPTSLLLLVLAGLSVSAAFVGIMMLVSSLGKTEQAAAGAGWAAILPMSMLGGGMVPLFAMPAWMKTASQFSPVKWAILALEGALWRGFTLQEMLLPCAILLAIGLVCFLVGARTFRALS